MASGIEGMEQFEVGLKEFTDKLLPAQVALVRDRLTLGVHRRVVLATPVKTGFHRNSWNASVGTPDERTPAPGLDHYPAPEMPTNLGGKDPFEAGWVTNAAPAITFLNEGSSVLAPAHFVQQAIEEELRDMGS